MAAWPIAAKSSKSIRRDGSCLTWRKEFDPEMHAEGFSRLTYELEQQGDMVKLTVLHQINRPDSKLIKALAGGWPAILSSLKSLLETGESLTATRSWKVAEELAKKASQA